MENKQEEIKIGEETIFMKKSFDGWRVIYPIKNKDGSFNWKHLIFGGNIWSFIKILAVFILLIFATIIYHYDTETCSNTLRNIDKICKELIKNNTQTNPLNFAELTGKGIVVVDEQGNLTYSGLTDEEIKTINEK